LLHMLPAVMKVGKTLLLVSAQALKGKCAISL